MYVIYGGRCPGCAVVCASQDAEHLDGCEYRGKLRLLTQAEADHLRECAEQDERDEFRRRHGLDEPEDLTEGPTGIAAQRSGRYV